MADGAIVADVAAEVGCVGATLGELCPQAAMTAIRPAATPTRSRLGVRALRKMSPQRVESEFRVRRFRFRRRPDTAPDAGTHWKVPRAAARSRFAPSLTRSPHRRHALVPLGGLFVGVAGAEDGRFVEGAAGELEADGQAASVKPQGNESAGRPATLNGIVNEANAPPGAIATPATLIVSSPMTEAGARHVGETSRSTSSSSLRNPSLTS